VRNEIIKHFQQHFLAAIFLELPGHIEREDAERIVLESPLEIARQQAALLVDRRAAGIQVLVGGAEGDVSIAFACNIMRDLCGSDWNPTEVLLSRRPPP
jgi:hypothetical protein